MADYCGNCANLRTDGACYYGNEYYCDVKGKTYPVNARACGSHIPKPDKGYKRAGIPWYIVTAICKRLGLPVDNDFLVTTYELRETHFPNLESGRTFLEEYDQLAPAISKYIECDDIETIAKIANDFVIPCTEYMRAGLYEEAMATYINMFESLKERYLSKSEILSRKAKENIWITP